MTMLKPRKAPPVTFTRAGAVGADASLRPVLLDGVVVHASPAGEVEFVELVRGGGGYNSEFLLICPGCDRPHWYRAGAINSDEFAFKCRLAIYIRMGSLPPEAGEEDVRWLEGAYGDPGRLRNEVPPCLRSVAPPSANLAAYRDFVTATATAVMVLEPNRERFDNNLWRFLESELVDLLPVEQEPAHALRTRPYDRPYVDVDGITDQEKAELGLSSDADRTQVALAYADRGFRALPSREVNRTKPAETRAKVERARARALSAPILGAKHLERQMAQHERYLAKRDAIRHGVQFEDELEKRAALSLDALFAPLIDPTRHRSDGEAAWMDVHATRALLPAEVPAASLLP